MSVALRRLPLRARLALGYSLFFAAVLLLLTAGVYWVVRNALLNEVAQELAATAALIQQDFLTSAGSLENYLDDPDLLVRALPPGIEGLETPTLYVQVADARGVAVATSASLRGQHLPLDPALRQAAMAGRATGAVADLGPGRVMQFVAPLSDGTAVIGVLQVAQPLRGVEQTLRVLLAGLTVTAVVAVVAAVRGGIWIARRSLRPVEEIAQTARQIVRASDLTRRVGAAVTDDEIGELTTTVNEMLARLEQLFTAQRRFVADVSHELRTPLTAMRGHLELLQRGITRGSAAQAESVADMLREVNRLSRMANDLLLLAQAEVGLQLRRAPFQMDELVLEVVRELRPLASGVTLRPELHEQVTYVGDRDRLKQALLNLVANALNHTPAGGEVVVTLERDTREARLQVRDNGPGIAPEDLPHVFERFYRGNHAHRAGGAGLGLAIVQWVAEAHGGGVDVASTPGAGATFTIHLPGSGPSQA
ncbi:MAG: HAMP domain-containing histidine kinase [Chloroflexaceae bacterium]|nr:HAMP domain-containing histidine kinase [Chloroflexaceae bacterium]